MKYFRSHILVELDESSTQRGAKEVLEAIKEELNDRNLLDEINVLQTGSLGFFNQGICLVIYPDNIVYGNMTVDMVPKLIEEHIVKGRILKNLVLDREERKDIPLEYDKRIVLSNSGIINPDKIEDYLGYGGYEAWEKVLLTMKPEDVVQTVKDSRLRGRGGAGFPAGLKWSFTAPIQSDYKCVVINADEGEPGTFKDRLIMEGDPHKLLEGTMIAAYAVAAHKAYIYIRGEYKLCIARLQNAIDQAYDYGLLGKNIFNSGFDLDISIKIGAGAYVCGEETALIESMEGNRGNPRSKPPYPGQRGYQSVPTVVNNVETIANVPGIILNGADWFWNIGTEESPGTKVFTILGDVMVPGLCEVEMGTTLRTIIEKYGGGMKKSGKFKAALVGGAAGVFLAEDMLDVKMDFHNLAEYKAVLGSGAILVMDDTVNIADMLESIIRFFRHESCGKCIPCSNGNENLYESIKAIKNGRTDESELEKMILLASTMYQTSFCALGQSLLLVVKSAIENFREDFLFYLNQNREAVNK
ncbi:MAG: NADH-quinone oxidoreductase subunit NuoF [Candidatus Cloacimonetes bacterium]|nr:NADH-quinone oxidoreductase subunit NuoF [Candidatus Cloacimonadota bacterium]